MSQSDPTDNALAAIASILEKPEPLREAEKPVVVEDKPLVPEPVQADGYFRVGPGPMDAIRFKWTVRQDNGDYYVDETSGDDSAPVVIGPMSKDAAIRLADDREYEARRRFEGLKSDMAGRSAAAKLVRKDSGEI